MVSSKSDAAGGPRILKTRSARPSQRTSRTAFFEDALDHDDPLLGFAPYIHKAPRRNSITPDRQRAFVAALAASGIVTQAARCIGASLEALYKLRALPGAEGFAKAWEMAIDRGMARLEDCALERALLGEERPVVSGGQWLGTWTRYDTPLLMFLLRHRRAARFGGGLRGGEGGEAPSPADVLDSIDAKLDRMRERWLAEQADDGDATTDRCQTRARHHDAKARQR